MIMLAINKMKKYILGVVMIVSLAACTDKFDELNVSPIALQEDRINENLLFTRAQVYGMLRYTEFQRAQHLYGNHYIQYYAMSVDKFETGRYLTVDSWLNDYWTAAYSDFGKQCFEVIKLTEDEPSKINKTAIAKIWQVFIMHRITDFWGDVPYTEAFDGNLFPRYDSQEIIYLSMLDRLKSAAASLDPAAPFGFGSSDLIYGGDIDLWKRFANSLRLRLAMRISDVNPTLAEQHVKELLAENLFIDNNDQTAKINYGRDQGGADENVQPMALIRSFNEYRASNTLVDILQDSNDPRLVLYIEPVSGNYVGLRNGLNPTEIAAITPNSYSKESNIISNVYAPSAAMQYSEVCFLKAEAALKGWGGDAKTEYEKGITASVNYWLDVYDYLGERVDASSLPAIAITDQDILDYIAQPEVAYDAAKALEQIITQKWIANISNGFESWAEYRRTGFPTLNAIPNTDGLSETGSSAVPTRVKYPIEEQSLNRDSYNGAILTQPDLVTARVWWDTK